MLYLSVDLEGMSGFRSGAEQQQNAHILREHILACASGIRKVSGGPIRAKSFHGKFPPGLPPFLEMVYSKSGEDFDLPQLDSGIDGLFLLGFHGLEPECGHGHSYRWPYLVLNGKRVGEITIQILLAASKGVPTLFFAGDRFGAQEAQSLVAGATIISLRSGQKADEGEMDESVLLRITDAAVKAALQNPRLSPPVLPGQYELGAPMRTAKEADEAEKLPFPVRRKDQTIFCDFSSFPEMYRFLMVDLWQSCSRATRPS